MEFGPVRILHKEDASRSKFCRELEAGNLPTVLVGGNGHWPAMALWDPVRNGLSHLKALAGSTTVQAITSDSGSAFYGYVKGHERVAVSFGSFIDSVASGHTGALHGHSSSSGNSKIDESRLSTNDVERFQQVDSCTRCKYEQDSTAERVDIQLYLAQVPIFSRTGDGQDSLRSLMQDIEMPLFLNKDRVSDINLWMSMGDARSSTHYDPDHNLLCVVAGMKKVTLWPPSAAPFLYPLPVNGEASNHSGVNFVQPDYNTHPLFAEALRIAKHVTLHPGDCLFIPEGWWHQVDNTGITIAVNFWWPSKLSLTLGTHMDAYFLRRVVASLVDREKEQMLRKGKENRIQRQPLPEAEARDMTSSKDRSARQLESISGYRIEDEILPPADILLESGPTRSMNAVDPGGGEDCTKTKASQAAAEKEMPSSSNNAGPCVDPVERNLQSGASIQAPTPGNTVYDHSTIGAVAESHQYEQSRTRLALEDLTSLETYNLDLVMTSLRSEASDVPDHERSGSVNGENRKESNDFGRNLQSKALKHQDSDKVRFSLSEDQVAGVFLASTARSLQRILLVMTNHFPRSLQTLILTRLSPCAAEILTRKFEEMDAVNDSKSQTDFYQQFYSAFDDSSAVMDALLDGKEAFAAQALSKVMMQYLGLRVLPSK